MQNVDCYSSHELDDYYPEEWRAEARVLMDDGRAFSAAIRYPLGDPHNPLTWEQLEARFQELVAPVIEDVGRRQALIDRVKRIDDMGWQDFLPLL